MTAASSTPEQKPQQRPRRRRPRGRRNQQLRLFPILLGLLRNVVVVVVAAAFFAPQSTTTAASFSPSFSPSKRYRSAFVVAGPAAARDGTDASPTTTPSYGDGGAVFVARMPPVRLLPSRRRKSGTTTMRGLRASTKQDDSGEDCAKDADELDDDDVGDDEASRRFSKSKWKKKRFLMYRDVQELIGRGFEEAGVAAQKAEEMVDRMHRLYARTGRDEYLPDARAYNLWIHAVAKSGGRNAGRRAEAILRRMQQQQRREYGEGRREAKAAADDDDGAADAGAAVEGISEETETAVARPNVVTYASVMDAYALAGEPEHAERILFELLEECDKRRKPAVVGGNRLTAALRDDDDDATDVDEDWRVTPIASDTVLKAWAQLGAWDGASRAEQILLRLEDIVDAQYAADMASVASAKATLSGTTVQPTAHSYATVIHGWASSRGGRAAAERASAVLDRMLERAEAAEKTASGGRRRTRKAVVEPDTVIFNSVMNAWATSRDPQAGSKAMELLDQMKQLQAEKGYDTRPDVLSYNTVISAWSHSNHKNAVFQAEKTLQEMVTAHRREPESPAPTTVTYNSLLHALSQSQLDGASERAEKFLEYMLKAKKKDILPDAYSFTSVLNAVAKSKDQAGKSLRAKSLLDRMCEVLYSDNISSSSGGQKHRPTQVPFNTV